MLDKRNKERLLRLASLKAIPGYIFVFLRPIESVISRVAEFDTIQEHWAQMTAILRYVLMGSLGYLVTTVMGVAWLSFLIIQKYPENSAPHPESDPDQVNGGSDGLREFRSLIPLLERRYIDREKPAPGRVLPAGWLAAEIRHLDMELRRRELDEISMDAELKVKPFKEVMEIDSPDELTRCNNILVGAWSRAQQEYRKVSEVEQTLLITWIPYGLQKSASQIRLPGGSVQLTPEILASVQRQMKDAVERFRLSLVLIESLLKNMRFKDPVEKT